MTYQVEFRNHKNPTWPAWSLDEEFESLGEAMSYTTSEALENTNFEHRITMKVTVMTYPRLEEY